jgi:hypothetical protein
MKGISKGTNFQLARLFDIEYIRLYRHLERFDNFFKVGFIALAGQ